MLSDKAKIFDADTTSFPSTHSFNSKKQAIAEKKHGNVLSLERSKPNTGKLKLAESARVTNNEPEGGNRPNGNGPNRNGNETETVGIKSRMEAILAGMKSRTATAYAPEAPGAETANKPYGEEIERRRAAIIAIAREAEVRSREAADTFREAETKLIQAEARLKEEMELRLLAEQHVVQAEEQSQQIQEKFKQIEEESRQWLDAAQAEETRRIEAEKAKAELEIRLKHETDARLLAEELRAEAEGKVEAAGQAFADAKQAAKEAEAKVQIAEEAARAAESLIYEADAIARKMEERCHAAEVNLQREAELRALAEQMLKELASVNPHPELNWQNPEAAMVQATSLPVGNPAAVSVSAEDGDALQQLRVQVEAEQKTRVAAEQSRADADAKALELETKLRKAEDKYRTTENGYKKVLRKQEEELRAMSEQVARNNDSGAVAVGVNSEENEMFLDITKPTLTRAQLKLVSYGVFITLLVLALVWLGTAAFQQL